MLFFLCSSDQKKTISTLAHHLVSITCWTRRCYHCMLVLGLQPNSIKSLSLDILSKFDQKSQIFQILLNILGQVESYANSCTLLVTIGLLSSVTSAGEQLSVHSSAEMLLMFVVFFHGSFKYYPFLASEMINICMSAVEQLFFFFEFMGTINICFVSHCFVSSLV